MDIDKKGVLDKEYSYARANKKELQFRLLYRAYMVKLATKRYLDNEKQLNILDLGSADGRTLIEMNQLLPENNFIGIEYSKELINNAQTLPKNIILINGDATKLPDKILKNKYDIISALAFLEHIKYPSEAVSEAYKALRHNGIFVATCPVPFWDKLSTKLGLIDEDQHEIRMTKKLFSQILVDNGFLVLEYRKFMWAPTSILPYLKIKISPYLSMKIEKFIQQFKIFNWLFVNQVIVGRKV
jgi:SAM-dependent methyltransferase